VRTIEVVLTLAAFVSYTTWLVVGQHLWQSARQRELSRKATIEAEAIRAVVEIGHASWQTRRRMIEELGRDPRDRGLR
jgi:hypothetical protein